MPRPARLDHLYDLISLVNIRDKDMDVRPLDLDEEWAWAQREVVLEVIRQYNAGKRVQIIVLKARQLGLSTICCAIVFNWIQIFDGAQALEIAHDNETTQSIFEKIQDAWQWWPFKALRHLRHASARRLTILETGSSVHIATARNVKSGRGRTVNILHASEMSHWEDPETLMGGLTRTVPDHHGSCILIECTANGVGNLYWQMWNDAVSGVSDYTPLFFPWWRHPEYRATHTQLRYVDLDEYERWLFDALGVDMLRLEWRRWSIANEFSGDEAMFRQEMPATPEEAFLASGRNVFPLRSLMDCYQPKNGVTGYLMSKGWGSPKFVRDPLGPLTIFRWPSSDREWGDYMAACDPSRTTMGDPACIQIVSRRTFEQVAVWHGHRDAVSIADDLVMVGRYYNEAMISTEIEGPGYGTIGALMAKGYPRIWQHRWADRHPGKVATNYGWSTNFQRKNLMVGNVQKRLVDKTLLIHDQLTYDQLRDFGVINDFGEMGHVSKDGHDDAVMAYCQAIACIVLESRPEYYEPGPPGQRKKLAPPVSDNNDLMGVPPWDAYGPAEEG